jgi:hypothetical protein
MSEPKFTKGPWKREGAFVYALQHYGWRRGVEETFCNRFSAGFSVGPGCSEEELIANARLAEAAPDLLEALINLLKTHEGEGGTRYHAGDIARAAIAKALGEQS